MENNAKVLVVVDYQVDFVSAALENPMAQSLENGIDAQIDATLSQGGYVVFTRDTHFDDYLQTREGKFLPVPHCIKNTDGWHLYGKLAKYENSQDNKILFVDNKFAFGSMALPMEIKRLCNGEPKAITMCGVVTNICVISNAILLHSNFLSTQIDIIENLCASNNRQDHDNAIDILRKMGYGII